MLRLLCKRLREQSQILYKENTVWIQKSMWNRAEKDHSTSLMMIKARDEVEVIIGGELLKDVKFAVVI